MNVLMIEDHKTFKEEEKLALKVIDLKEQLSIRAPIQTAIGAIRTRLKSRMKFGM